jgi:L-aminopeptidase/D-esterase-like protein
VLTFLQEKLSYWAFFAIIEGKFSEVKKMEWVTQLGLTEIAISEIQGVRFGQVDSEVGMTGVSVALFAGKNRGGVDISGGGPASRESTLLAPLTDEKALDALVFSGGSAFGLAASDGVMRYLEERGKGYPVGKGVVPLVAQACIFDLNIGDVTIRPTAELGYLACQAAEQRREPQSGAVGAGKGATVGNLCGMNQSQKAGIGYFAVQLGTLQVGAMVVVNALGDVFDFVTAKKIAGLMNPKRTAFLSSEAALYQSQGPLAKGVNTTLGAIFTNAAFSASDMNKIASMSRTALARSIKPVNTMADGDTIYAFSLGEVVADVNLVGSLASTVLSGAITKAITSVHLADEDYLIKVTD